MNDNDIMVGKDETDRRRNALLLTGYDYTKYTEFLTGYTGQDLQRIGQVRWERAVRARVGPRANYKGGLAQLPNGKLVTAVCRRVEDSEPKRQWKIFVYESDDQGATWLQIGRSDLYGKEPSLTALPDGGLVLTAQRAPLDNTLPVSRSRDGGRTWTTVDLPGPNDYPRNLIVYPDGSLMMIRAMLPDWRQEGGGSPNLQVGWSRDGGGTWDFFEGIVDWDFTVFGEVASLRLKSGRLLAALRRQIPGTRQEAFEDTVLTESLDEGKTWSTPRPMLGTAEVHGYLTELNDGRLLCTYSNYHLPWGVFAVISGDGGKTWDLEHPIQLALSADFYVGWAVTLQLADSSLITSYATTTYYQESPNNVTFEVVRWNLSI